MDLTKISPEFAKDLIELVNDLGSLQKTAAVSYGNTRFHYVPLDDMLAKIKQNGNFAFMQPLGIMQDGKPCIKCLLIHKSGESIISDPYPLRIREGAKKQDEGAEITYSRRYCAASFLGIASDEDTDANNEGNPTYTKRQQSQPTLPPKVEPQNGAISKTTGEKINYLVRKYQILTQETGIVASLEKKMGKKCTEFSEADGQNAVLLLNAWIKKAENNASQGA